MSLAALVIATFFVPVSASQASAAGDSLDVKIGQMIMTGFRGLTVRPGSAIAEDIRTLHLGGVVLFDFDVATKEYGRNIASPMQLLQLTSDLQEASHIPLFIAVDQEGGTVARLKARSGFPKNVSHAYLGNVNVDDTTRYYADIMARSLSVGGINVNFSPVVDLNVNPSNPVIGKLGRSISAKPDITAHHAGLMIDAMHDWGVLSAVKHFPGHGSSRADSHMGFVDVSETWSKTELLPYRSLIKEGKPDMVMTAHIFNRGLDDALPATLSRKTIDGLLRTDLGYDGVVVSDDLMMKAIADDYGMETAIEKAVLAGIDILLFANNTYTYEPDIARKAFSILKSLVERGVITRERIDISFRRIMKLKGKMTGNRLER
jgi:beta-N-acetylhexosaminidase